MPSRPTQRGIAAQDVRIALTAERYHWHMRAYCQKRAQFQDFVLPRIFGIEGREFDEEGGQGDLAWHCTVQLVLVPHPRLEDYHRAAIELDYSMQDGECFLECRQALVFYVMQQLGLSEEDPGKSAKAQQIR